LFVFARIAIFAQDRRFMTTIAGIQACIVWELLYSSADGFLEDPGLDYGGMLDGMDAAELLALMGQIQQRLTALGLRDNTPSGDPQRLFIDKNYNIHLGKKEGRVISLRPLVKAVFILFLKHPEGILLKERGRYENELNDIYAVIAPNVAAEYRQERIGRLVDPADNSFSEKASVLNARLERILPRDTIGYYKIQGTNGYPRRIPLDPLLITWG
jgi:hypothetical protein